MNEEYLIVEQIQKQKYSSLVCVMVGIFERSYNKRTLIKVGFRFVFVSNIRTANKLY